MFLSLLGDSERDMLFHKGLDESLASLARWDAQGLTIGMAVNIPPNPLLDSERSGWVMQALERHAIPAHRLTLELLETESVNPAPRDKAIEQLVALGVKLAVDDLGSSYSSLQRLAALPFDVIKIDQGLLARIRQNPVQTLSLIRAIVQMGPDFEREVVVEGLEGKELIEAAGTLGARYGQGFGLAKPMPAEQVVPWSRRFEHAVADGTLHTFLGALAFHWQFMHDGVGHQPVDVEDCPLTRFMREQASGEGEAAAWHAGTHAGGDVQASSHKLSA